VSTTLPLPKQRKGSANTSVLLPSRGLAGRAGSFLRDSAPLTWGTPYDILSPDSRTSVGPSCVGWDTARVGPGPRGCKERKVRLHSGEPSAPYCPGIPRAGGEWPKPLPPLRMENAIARSCLLVIFWLPRCGSSLARLASLGSTNTQTNSVVYRRVLRLHHTLPAKPSDKRRPAKQSHEPVSFAPGWRKEHSS